MQYSLSNILMSFTNITFAGLITRATYNNLYKSAFFDRTTEGFNPPIPCVTELDSFLKWISVAAI